MKITKSKPVKCKPSDKDRDHGLDSIYYEMRMFAYCAESSLEFQGEGEKESILLESLLLHIRILLEFFEKDCRTVFRKKGVRIENDTILSKDYRFNPQPIKIPKIYRERLNPDLAHLSYSRHKKISSIDKSWKIKDIVVPIARKCIEFLECLGNSKLEKSIKYSLVDWKCLKNKLKAIENKC